MHVDASRGYFIVCVHSSSWCRAHDKTGTGMPVRYHNRLILLDLSLVERHFGDFEIRIVTNRALIGFNIELVSILDSLSARVLHLGSLCQYLLGFVGFYSNVLAYKNI